MIKIDISTENVNEYVSPWYYPNTDWPSLTVKWLKLPSYYSFNLEKLREEFKKIEEEFKFHPFVINKEGRQRITYQGISLTSRNNSFDPEHDGLKLFGFDKDKNEIELDIRDVFVQHWNKLNSKSLPPQLNEKIFDSKSKAYRGYFAEVIDRFHSKKTKCRILNLKPRGIISPHVDFPYYQQIRVHAALYTNEDTWFEVEGVKFKIPADGNFYWFDVGRHHAVCNNGKTDRITLSVNLSVYENYTNNDNLIDLINNCKI